VLVYWYDYPKRENIRWKFVFIRILLTLLGFLCMYIMQCETIIPLLKTPKTFNIIHRTVMMVIPQFLMWIMYFFTVWDWMLNVIGEVTKFGDREFYEDWWNSLNYYDFNKKWNKVVHEYFYRHVYAEAVHTWYWSRGAASLWVFFISGLLHEIMMILVFRRLRPVFLTIIMFQVPYTKLLRRILIGYSDRFKNFITFTGIAIGFPLINALYFA